MKRFLALLLALCLLVLAGCGQQADAAYRQISQEEAKEMMDAGDAVVLDVREQSEYDEGHIPGAVLLPVGSIDEDTAAAVIPEKSAAVLVYCRSGNRSKTAAAALAELGYTDVCEFGGINTWPYEIEQ
ncbi:rhodanese-like domain-containing protein [Candidatus Allofournierella excrementavium]|uniref:rhodanese-like domain-containing protein n=1 Tax=Candidatus Allofournierella excrementavium TaxID=2838591 RepID=UPI003AF67C02